MDKKIVHLPNSELEIMMILWEATEPVPRTYIDDRLAGRKTWSPTTILKFLSRLTEKGFVLCDSQGKGRSGFFSAAISEDDYLEFEGKSLLGRLCGRSIKKLVATLYDNETISDTELDELQAFLEERRKSLN